MNTRLPIRADAGCGLMVRASSATSAPRSGRRRRGAVEQEIFTIHVSLKIASSPLIGVSVDTPRRCGVSGTARAIFGKRVVDRPIDRDTQISCRVCLEDCFDRSITLRTASRCASSSRTGAILKCSPAKASDLRRVDDPVRVKVRFSKT